MNLEYTNCSHSSVPYSNCNINLAVVTVGAWNFCAKLVYQTDYMFCIKSNNQEPTIKIMLAKSWNNLKCRKRLRQWLKKRCIRKNVGSLAIVGFFRETAISIANPTVSFLGYPHSGLMELTSPPMTANCLHSQLILCNVRSFTTSCASYTGIVFINYRLPDTERKNSNRGRVFFISRYSALVSTT